MKERPIIFSSEMVLAILDGRKSQTRRIIKLQSDFYVESCYPAGTEAPPAWWDFWGKEKSKRIKSPYTIGDRLWVRETWMPETEQGCPTGGRIYKASDKPEPDGDMPLRWRSPIFMPHWASRITLEITGVRVERVQDISEMDAKAEGLNCSWLIYREGNEAHNKRRMEIYRKYGEPVKGNKDNWLAGEREEYAYLWDSLNAKRGYGWKVNPFVWVISFKRIEGRVP